MAPLFATILFVVSKQGNGNDSQAFDGWQSQDSEG
jgi:hypothetical protein